MGNRTKPTDSREALLKNFEQVKSVLKQAQHHAIALGCDDMLIVRLLGQVRVVEQRILANLGSMTEAKAVRGRDALVKLRPGGFAKVPASGPVNTDFDPFQSRPGDDEDDELA